MVAALVFALTAATCSPATEADLHTTFDAWVAAYDARDLAGTMAIFSPDVVFQFQGSPDQSYADLERGYRTDFAHASTTQHWVPTFESVLVSGDLADVYSTWRLEVSEGGQTRVTQTNHGVDAFRRGPDCHWRIVHSLNYPVPAAH